MPSAEARLEALRGLLGDGRPRTQEELRLALAKAGHPVNQSTVSRDLRKLNSPSQRVPPIGAMVLDVAHNGSLIVVRTLQDSAAFVALHLDRCQPEGVLGTIAGHDTVFVAPADYRSLDRVFRAVKQALLGPMA